MKIKTTVMIIDIFRLATEFIKEKIIKSPGHQFLSLLISLSITTLIFTKIFPEFTWTQTDSGWLLTFFLKAYYLLPIITFCFIDYALYRIADIVFTIFSASLFSKSYKQINNFKLTQSEHNYFIITLNKIPFLPFTIDTPMLIELYREIKVSPELRLDTLIATLEKKKEKYMNYAILTFKFIIAFCLMFESTNIISSTNFIIILITSILFLFASFFFYVILDITPLIIKITDRELAKLVSGENKLLPLITF